MSIDLLILRNRVRLDKMIRENVGLKKIVRQRKRLDNLINTKMEETNSR